MPARPARRGFKTGLSRRTRRGGAAERHRARVDRFEGHVEQALQFAPGQRRGRAIQRQNTNAAASAAAGLAPAPLNRPGPGLHRAGGCRLSRRLRQHRRLDRIRHRLRRRPGRAGRRSARTDSCHSRQERRRSPRQWPRRPCPEDVPNPRRWWCPRDHKLLGVNRVTEIARGKNILP